MNRKPCYSFITFRAYFSIFATLVLWSLPSQKAWGENLGQVVIKSLRVPGHELVLGNFKTPITKDIDLGDDWYGILELRGLKSSGEFSVEMRYETTMVIRGEGPHLDLVNWKHYKSEWSLAKANSPTQFEIISPGGSDQYKFPFVSKSELMEAVKKYASTSQDSKFWNDQAKLCEGPLNYPCDVDISKVHLKIYEGTAANRKLIQEIVMKIPMGC